MAKSQQNFGWQTLGSLGLAGLLALLTLSSSQISAQTPAEICAARQTCDECIVSDDLCGWCAGDTTCKDVQGTCASNQWYNPSSSIDSSTDGATYGDVAPTSVQVSLRKDEPLTVPIVITPTHKPINFLYLFDMSYSMGDDQDAVVALGNDLTDFLNGLCSGGTYVPGGGSECAYLSLASHVDKPIEPFGRDFDYVYRPGSRHMDGTFSTNADAFARSLSDASLRDGGDVSESQLEALMQGVMCGGWSGADRRNILLLATDATFHLSHDAELPDDPANAIFDRSTATCYAPNGEGDLINSASLTKRTPSIGQVAEALVQQNIVPIFAVGTDASDKYQDFADTISFGSVGEISTDSSNILAVIESAYNEIAGTIVPKVQDGDYAGFISNIAPSRYDNVPIGESRTVNIVLEWNDESPQTDGSIVISFLGFSDVTIDVSLLDACDCAGAGLSLRTCDDDGTVGSGTDSDCGLCVCEDGYEGVDCACNTGSGDNSECIDPDNGLVCSGRGTCVCGACECDVGWEKDTDIVGGDNCACSTIEGCLDDNGGICNGNGVCECGECNCSAGFTSESKCLCSDSPAANCPMHESVECNGHGTCNNAVDSIDICEPFCECEAGWEGDACECALFCDGGCNEENNGGVCNCGTCECQGIYASKDGFDADPNCRCPTGADGACPTNDADEECSNNGTCDCGECICDADYTGDDCSCSTAPCPFNCAGNGSCNCGECTCDEGFLAPSCACPDTTVCPKDSFDQECGGVGSCNTSTPGECGTCTCPPGYTGDACECRIGACPIGSNGLICSGRGECSGDCGACECDEGFTGPACGCEIAVAESNCINNLGNCTGSHPYDNGTCIIGYDSTNTFRCGECECDLPITESYYTDPTTCTCLEGLCPKDNLARECSGNGSCTCSVCECDEGFKADPNKSVNDCSCVDTTCTIGTNGEECSGKGTCGCDGTCNCDLGYEGDDCGICNQDIAEANGLPDCPGSGCGDHDNCEDCTNDDECLWCGTGVCRYREYAPRLCATTFENADECPELVTSTRVIEKPEVQIPVIAGGITLLIGLLAIIAFKVYGVIMDRREWAKFEAERANARWRADENPLFKTSTKEYANPLFNGDDAAAGGDVTVVPSVASYMNGSVDGTGNGLARNDMFN
eukprot:Clim_evm36s229 gene=Clim_evmTU36s229